MFSKTGKKLTFGLPDVFLIALLSRDIVNGVAFFLFLTGSLCLASIRLHIKFLGNGYLVATQNKRFH